MSDSTPHWYDDDAGPVVRLYAMTAGRARPSSEAFDLMAVVRAQPREAGEVDETVLSPEQRELLALCSREPRPVAEIASDSGLPLGVVRVLLSDLLTAGQIRVSRPVPPAQLPDARILREVINGLRAL
ncbi:DUF742 domain-containing protein [Streptomyces pathocidini]|uniref:DUF742 domain-containing protein n=1 Tax=Streptomyces pathocidini TaxID=1650571 RepID=A0ABW7UTW5_9ACTN|nr:DUF742 domain-containing protein [Streptomyces pathocidini]